MGIRQFREDGRGRRFVRERFIRPFAEFAATEASSGIVLLVATAVALAWANSYWSDAYFDLWRAGLALDLNVFTIEQTLGHAVNDGLMTIFFFVAGLEIKRELLRGELASPRKAALPIAAALGGMAVPALIYAAWNVGGDGAKGWGIPMATDIAFAMGVLALLGRRAPASLRVFLLALAIADDLGAILVIALFYTESISWEAVGWGVAVIAAIRLFERGGVRSTGVYVALGACFWAAVFKSGIHATIAGVVLAMITPARPYYSERDFAESAAGLIDAHREARDRNDSDAGRSALGQLEVLSRDSASPLDRLEGALHPWVSYLVVPVFALANAGVALSGGLLADAARSPVSLGIAVGLVAGKPLGILLACLLVTRLRLADLPSNVGYSHLLGAGMVAGIGFTVSLFITSLAFNDAALVAEAKVGVLAASLVAGVAGFVYLWFAPGEPAEEPALELSPIEA